MPYPLRFAQRHPYVCRLQIEHSSNARLLPECRALRLIPVDAKTKSTRIMTETLTMLPQKLYTQIVSFEI